MLCPLVYKKNLSKKCFIQKYDSKNFGPKRSRVKKFGSKNIGSKNFLVQLDFRSKKFWIQKNSVQKFWVQNDLGPKHLGPKTFSLKKLKWKQTFRKEKLGLKNNLVQKYWINKKLKSKKFLAPPDLPLKFGENRISICWDIPLNQN